MLKIQFSSVDPLAVRADHQSGNRKCPACDPHFPEHCRYCPSGLVHGDSNLFRSDGRYLLTKCDECALDAFGDPGPTVPDPATR